MRTLAALAVFLFWGCASGPDPWTVKSPSADAVAEADWARYHWYIPALTYEVRGKWVSDNGYDGPWIRISMRMEAKALTQEGAAAVGTLHLEHWNHETTSLQVSHWDSAGRTVPVPIGEVRERFRRDGVVVVPRVAKGSTVLVYITEGPFSALNDWEMTFDAQVPVLRSEFRLTAPKSFGFNVRGYNGLGDPEVESNGGALSPTRIWSASRIMPLSDLPYADRATARPRLLFMNSCNSWGTCAKDWKYVAKEKRKRDFATGLFGTSRATREQALRLSQGLEGAEKARCLLAWVQDNITIVGGKTKGVGLDAVLERRKGTEEQAAALLKAMYDAADLPSAIVLSRPRERGGFDPDAPDPNALAVPLVVVTLGGRRWAAYPQSASYAFGDFPAGLAGLQALELESGSVAPLPGLAHPQSRWESRQDVPLDGSPTRKAEVELSGPWAAELRARWIGAGGGDPQEACRKWLKGIGFTGVVRACAVRDLADREKPFRLALTLDNGLGLVEDARFNAWNVPNLLTRPTWFYDSARVDAYLLPQDQIRKETVRFTAPAGKKVQLEVPCRPFSDSILQVTCASPDSGDGFARETIVRKGLYAPAALRARHAYLAVLDRNREVRVTTRSNPPAR